MSRQPAIWSGIHQHLQATRPDAPVLYFAPEVLQATARRFQAGFPGLVTYAVKANDSGAVLENLVAAGITAFDVASPDEMAAVRAVAPRAALHYNNPVRSRSEITAAVRFGVSSYSVDDAGELAKLTRLVAPGTEVSVRLKLAVAGAAYDFGSKFGVGPDGAVTLLQAVQAAGFAPAMTFHPGTQCADPEAWAVYIRTCADVAARAGVTLTRLNVGGGFAARRGAEAPDLEAVFAAIRQTARAAFCGRPPALVCEPGRAMVADAFTLAARVKALRADGSVFLNDGIYGALSEAPILGVPDRVQVIAPDGLMRTGGPIPRVVFGPTCDSLDRLPEVLRLPADTVEEDYVLFGGLGAYSTATTTRFNGYGRLDHATVREIA